MSADYSFGKYTNLERWASFWHQINEALRFEPKRILEIGVGDGVFGNYIKTHFSGSIEYVSADSDDKLDSDVVADVRHLPFPDGSFDLVCAFEILEHLPFDQLPSALAEIRRVTRGGAVISLPHWGRHFAFSWRLPFFGRGEWQYKFGGLPIRHIFDGEHHWEIGKKDYPLKIVQDEISRAGWKIERDFIPPQSPYHHFFVLKKN